MNILSEPFISFVMPYIEAVVERTDPHSGPLSTSIEFRHSTLESFHSFSFGRRGLVISDGRGARVGPLLLKQIPRGTWVAHCATSTYKIHISSRLGGPLVPYLEVLKWGLSSLLKRRTRQTQSEEGQQAIRHAGVDALCGEGGQSEGFPIQ